MTQDEVEKFLDLGWIVPTIRERSAWPLLSDLGAIFTARRVFEGNHGELIAALRRADDEAGWDALVSDLAVWAPFRDDVDRLMHNYLASAYTLSGTERKAATRWLTGIKPDAYENATPFGHDGVPAFVFGLRNVVQHQRLPWVRAVSEGHRCEDGSHTWNTSWCFRRDDLLALSWDYSKVGKRGRQYVESLATDPDLGSIVDEFTATSLKFATWLYDQFQVGSIWEDATKVVGDVLSNPAGCAVWSHEKAWTESGWGRQLEARPPGPSS